MKTNRREIFFRCGALLAVLLGIAVCVWGSGPLLTPKWLDDREWEPASEIMAGFYAEPDDTLDILFLGSSHVFCGVNPLCIFDETGLRSYDLASGLQRAWVSYYYLLEALKTQKPSLVVLDTSELFDDENNTEPRNRMAFDYMHPSSVKWKAVAASAQPEESLVSYLFPSIRYHERIFDLSGKDFEWVLRKNHRNYLHGYRFEYMDRTARVSFAECDKTASAPEGIWNPGSKSKSYLDQMVEFCRKNRTELVLVTIPTTAGWGWPEHCRIRDYAEEKGLKYYDFNTEIQEIGLSPTSDFYDAAHLNIRGAAKFSRYLGRKLRDDFALAGNGDLGFSGWKDDYSVFHGKSGLYAAKGDRFADWNAWRADGLR